MKKKIRKSASKLSARGGVEIDLLRGRKGGILYHRRQIRRKGGSESTLCVLQEQEKIPSF